MVRSDFSIYTHTVTSNQNNLFFQNSTVFVILFGINMSIHYILLCWSSPLILYTTPAANVGWVSIEIKYEYT
jgi:hypothetical protein